MNKIEKKIKLLSVNQAWQGKRYKSKKYSQYEKSLLWTLPNISIPNFKQYYIVYIFKFSNNLFDWDNPIKPLQDILQKKYGFNDRDITIALTFKKLVSKKNEGFIVYIGDAINFYSDLKNIDTERSTL